MICYFQKDFLKIEEHMEMHLNANHCSRETQMLKVFSIKALFLYKSFFSEVGQYYVFLLLSFTYTRFAMNIT